MFFFVQFKGGSRIEGKCLGVRTSLYSTHQLIDYFAKLVQNWMTYNIYVVLKNKTSAKHFLLSHALPQMKFFKNTCEHIYKGGH